MKRFAIPVGVGVLLVVAAAVTANQTVTFPMRIADVIHEADYKMTDLKTLDYFPAQFFKEAQRGVIEELPPQF